MAKLSFIGAGPGDPELITLKAVERIKTAGLILYAGSLVPMEVFAKHTDLPNEKIINSADLTLEETHSLIVNAIKRGENVARIHTGDPSVYGAIHEQMALLDQEEIDYEIIPGISSAMAAAAELKVEFTVPESTQTVILTRLEGRTPVPDSEDLASLAAHRSSLVIFLSAHLVDKVQEKLLVHYPPETPVAVAYRVGWPDSKIFRTELENLPALMAKEGIKRQALILIGPALAEKKKTDARSILYGKEKKRKV